MKVPFWINVGRSAPHVGEADPSFAQMTVELHRGHVRACSKFTP